MLTKSENRVMRAVYSAALGKPAVLITPADLLKLAGDDGLTLSRLEKIVTALHQDGYFDLVYSDRHGETVYCITLSEKGKAFRRDAVVMKRNLIFRIGLSVGLAVLSFLIGLLLKAIF